MPSSFWGESAVGVLIVWCVNRKLFEDCAVAHGWMHCVRKAQECVVVSQCIDHDVISDVYQDLIQICIMMSSMTFGRDYKSSNCRGKLEMLPD